MSAFKVVQALTAYQGLPLSYTFLFDEVDPKAPIYTRPLDLTDRTLSAQLRGRPKVKVKQVKVVDPPAPGVYEFELLIGGETYAFSITIEAGETAADFIEKLEKALANLEVEIKACADTCGAAGELVVIYPWPGVLWDLVLVSEPVPDQVDIIDLQDAITLLATFTVSAVVQGDYQAITIKLSGAQTSGLPAAGDGPFTYTLIAANDNDVDDVLLLARGHIIVAHL